VVIPIPVPPTPEPPPDPCLGLAGHYEGTCVSSAGHSHIYFDVLPVGPSCVAANTFFFRDVALIIGPTAATAPLAKKPGGPAITATELAVFGLGRFQISGYNTAGNFSFNCQD
jgi:hypothetical protein